MNRLGLLPIDIFRPQTITLTYVHITKTKVTYKWLDHVWIASKNQHLVTSIRIADVQGNTSDHLPILVQYNLIKNEAFGEIMKKPKPIILTLNHETQNIIHTYSPLVQSKLIDTCSIIFNKLKSAFTPE